jgi:hypothetical protein
MRMSLGIGIAVKRQVIDAVIEHVQAERTRYARVVDHGVVQVSEPLGAITATHYS